jgi:hypothetical protein
MRRGKQWTVDWGAEGGGPSSPAVGHIVHRITPTEACGGYWRVTSVRQVKVRKPLPPIYAARYRIGIEEIGEPERVDWTMRDHPRRPKPRPFPPMRGRLPADPSRDPFSPLL